VPSGIAQWAELRDVNGDRFMIDQNLRRADFAENLGVYLLRPFAAVAPVLRADDFGLDAIATLLRPETGRTMVAERSFYVQLKAASVTSVT
jgi:hypothetical protein